MLPLRIADATRVLAEGQDEYHALAVKDGVVELPDGRVVPAMTSAWEPTPKELRILMAGGSVRLTILGLVHPPLMMEVNPAPSVVGI